jgi:transcriptional regulator with XRE-family HTH domain
MKNRDLLQKWMTESGINQNQLARLSGVPQPTIGRILSGKTHDPKNTTLAKLVAHLGHTLDELSSGQSLELREDKSTYNNAPTAEELDYILNYYRPLELKHRRMLKEIAYGFMKIT